MKSIGFHIWRIGIYLYLQNLWKYRQIYLFPGLMIEGVNGNDRYFDIEVKIIFLSFGIRLIWIKNQKNLLYLYRIIFKKRER